MRLWHIDLIPYLPKSQLLAQWRELNSIFKKQDKHILINYIYDYPKNYLKNYAIDVKNEMHKRGYKINSFYNYNEFFNHDKPMGTGSNCFIVARGNERFKEHNHEYLTICYNNLKEKYLRGQKDFTDDVWQRLDEFYQVECVKQILPDGFKWSNEVLKDVKVVSQNQTAIDELEKVKDKTDELMFKINNMNYFIMVKEEIYDFIDQQIKLLKGEV